MANLKENWAYLLLLAICFFAFAVVVMNGLHQQVSDAVQSDLPKKVRLSQPNHYCRFLFLGDLHYAMPHYRSKDVVEAIAGELATLQPPIEFVAQIGDLKHSQHGSKPATLEEARQEWLFAFSHMKKAFSLPFFIALGNHDWYGDTWGGGKKNIEEIYIPFQGKELGIELKVPFYSFDWGNSHFVFLNHLHFDSAWDEKQSAWLEEDLRRAKEDATIKHLFAFGHPLLWNVGNRVSFDEHWSLRDLFAKQKIDAYFCGHVHCNTVSVYRINGFNLTQISGVPIGADVLRDMSLQTLILQPPPQHRVFSRHFPGLKKSYFIVTVDSSKVKLDFHIVGQGAVWQLEFPQPGKIVETKVPPQPISTRLTEQDLARVKSAELNLCPLTPQEARISVLCNGEQIGSLPVCQSWVNPKVVKLEFASKLLKLKNHIRIRNPDRVKFGVKDCYIAVTLENGSIVHTSVLPYVAFSCPDYLSLSNALKRWIPKELVRTVALGEDIAFNLSFTAP